MSYKGPNGGYNSGGSYNSRHGTSYGQKRLYDGRLRYPNGGQNGTTRTNGYGNQYGHHSSKNYQSNTSQQARRVYGARNNNNSNRNPYSRQTPNESNELWMGDLDSSWTENTILGFWNALGVLPINVKVIKDKVNTLKSLYCFVTFEDVQTASLAILKNGQKIPGTQSTLKLNWASGGSASKVSQAGVQGGGISKVDPKGRNDNSLFIGDLSPEVNDLLLFQKFKEKYPNQIRQVKVMTDLQTGQSKGFGFVRFFSPEYQQRALKEMNGQIIGNRPIKVGIAAGSGQTGSNDIINNGTQSTMAMNQSQEAAELARIHIPQSQPPINEYTDPNNTTICIMGLSGKLSEQEIQQYVSPFGKIISVRLSSDRNSCLVTFIMRSSAEMALLYLHGLIINDCDIEATWGLATKPYQKAQPIPLFYGSSISLHYTEPLRDDSERIPLLEFNLIYCKESSERRKVLDAIFY